MEVSTWRSSVKSHTSSARGWRRGGESSNGHGADIVAEGDAGAWAASRESIREKLTIDRRRGLHFRYLLRVGERPAWATNRGDVVLAMTGTGTFTRE